MIATLLLYAASIILIFWGIAHIMPIRTVVRGFGEISLDNKRIIAQTWVSEGLALVFIGMLVLLVTIYGEQGATVSNIVYWCCSAMLGLLALWHLPTGARTPILPMKICVAILLLTAGMILAGSLGS